MDLLEKYNGAMQHTESKRAAVQKAVQSLLVECKNLEYADSSTQQLLHECCTDIQRRQEQLNKVQEDVTNRNQNLDEREKGLQERLEAVESKEKGFRVMLEDLEVKMKKLESAREALEREAVEKFSSGRRDFDRFKASIEEKLEKLKMKEKDVEEREMKLNRDLIELDEKMKKVVEKEKEVELKMEGNKVREDELDAFLVEIDVSKRDVVERENEVEAKLKIIETREIELYKATVEHDIKMKNVEDMEKRFERTKRNFSYEEEILSEKKKTIRKRENELDLGLYDFHAKMKYLRRKGKQIEQKEKSFRNWETELAVKESKFGTRNMELEWALLDFDLMKNDVKKKEEELQMMENSINNRKIELQSKENEVKLLQVTCEERCRNLEMEKGKLEDQIKELEVKNKQFSNVDHSVVKPEPWSDDGSYADLRFSITMDGKNLLLYLINHKMPTDSTTKEIYKVLRLSMDPARIVLDAMQNFYVIKEDKEFEEDVVCRSSILLLEQLRKISPHIQSYHKNAALELASKWKVKMKSSMEVIVFLQLLASYKLGSSFEPEEFLSLIDDQPTQVSELFQLLGYMEKISDLIISLIQRGDRLQAIWYIYEYNLVEKFQPVPILEDHIRLNELLAEDIHRKNTSDEPADDAIDKQLASLRAVVKCIKDHQLEVEYPPKSLLARIQQLEEQFKKDTKRANVLKKFGKKRHAAGSNPGPNAQKRQRIRERRRTEPPAVSELEIESRVD